MADAFVSTLLVEQQSRRFAPVNTP